MMRLGSFLVAFGISLSASLGLTEELDFSFRVPLTSGKEWKVLSFRKIPAHVVEFGSEGLKVQVKKSAGPIVYRLVEPKTLRGIKVKGAWRGDFKRNMQQGDKGFDDYLLRVGLVVPGKKKLGFFQKSVAPSWVTELHDLAPKGQGIDRIEFFNVTSLEKQVGNSRLHPASDLLRENFVWLNVDEGEFSYETVFQAPIETLAIWIAIDGDDTGSIFDIQLTELNFEP